MTPKKGPPILPTHTVLVYLANDLGDATVKRNSSTYTFLNAAVVFRVSDHSACWRCCLLSASILSHTPVFPASSISLLPYGPLLG